jgi:hypothetical protein
LGSEFGNEMIGEWELGMMNVKYGIVGVGICLIERSLPNESNQQNKPNQPDRPDKPDKPVLFIA